MRAVGREPRVGHALDQRVVAHGGSHALAGAAARGVEVPDVGRGDEADVARARGADQAGDDLERGHGWGGALAGGEQLGFGGIDGHGIAELPPEIFERARGLRGVWTRCVRALRLGLCLRRLQRRKMRGQRRVQARRRRGNGGPQLAAAEAPDELEHQARMIDEKHEAVLVAHDFGHEIERARIPLGERVLGTRIAAELARGDELAQVAPARFVLHQRDDTPRPPERIADLRTDDGLQRSWPRRFVRHVALRSIRQVAPSSIRRSIKRLPRIGHALHDLPRTRAHPLDDPRDRIHVTQRDRRVPELPRPLHDRPRPIHPHKERMVPMDPQRDRHRRRLLHRPRT